MRDLLYFKSPAFNLFSRSFLLSIIICHPLYLSCLSPITFVLYTFLLLFCSSTHFLITLTLSNNRLISRFAFPISFSCPTFYYFSMIFFNFVVAPFSFYHSSCFLFFLSLFLFLGYPSFIVVFPVPFLFLPLPLSGAFNGFLILR